MSDQYLNRIVLNEGNQNALKEVMKKAERGEKVTIGYLGGSITRGSVATTPEKCYAYLSYLWWKEQFPNTESVYVNAGIGATTSQFAVARCEEDLLYANPDLVMIEFSVNDENDEHFMETYEGLIRKVLTWKSHPAVVLLHNSFFNDGHSAVEIHSKVGKYYDLPSVSIKANVYDRIKDGVLVAETITSDYLHPNDEGHAMLADTIKHFWNNVYAKVEEKKADYVFPEKPMTKNRYETSKRLQGENLPIVENTGFVQDQAPQTDMTDIFKNGMEAFELGGKIVFKTKCTTLSLQYRRTIRKPAPMAKVVVDGNEEMAIFLDGEFDETWGDLIALETIFEGEKEQEHTLSVEICKGHEKEESGFYLVSVITS